MIERGFVDLYSYVCRELNLNNEERHRLWLDIVREIERLEKYLADPANATDEEIRKACSDLGIPTFRTRGLKIIRMRESAAGWLWRDPGRWIPCRPTARRG